MPKLLIDAGTWCTLCYQYSRVLLKIDNLLLCSNCLSKQLHLVLEEEQKQQQFLETQRKELPHVSE